MYRRPFLAALFSVLLASDVTPTVAHSAQVASTVFVADAARNAVFEFPAGVNHPKPIRTITNGIVNPLGIATDDEGMLYVVNGGATPSFTVYPHGGVNPVRTVPTAPVYPAYIAVSHHGTVYITGIYRGAAVAEFPQGARQPSQVVHCCTETTLNQVVVDARDDVYVREVTVGPDHIFTSVVVFPPPLNISTATTLKGSSGPGFNESRGYDVGGITFDASGMLLAAEYLKFRAFMRIIRPDGTIDRFAVPVGDKFGINNIAFDRTHRLIYLTTNVKTPSTVDIVNAATHRLVGSIDGFSNATGIAISPQIY